MIKGAVGLKDYGGQRYSIAEDAVDEFLHWENMPRELISKD